MSSWRGVLDFPVSGRAGKPRTTGLTMVIDKGLGLADTRDLLEMAAPYIDFLKMAFGSSLLYPERMLRAKIDLAKSYGVEIYPGGTLLEVAAYQDRVGDFLRRTADLGFTFVEVSEGTIDLPRGRRQELIERARDAGFGVLTEIGKKDPAQPLAASRAVTQVHEDLRHGAHRVIVEGRDSGRNIGIYDGAGRVREDLLDGILAGLPTPDAVIWEAPQTAQQQHLLMKLGPNVSLGNVQPADIITLESTRVGLRGDTLRLCVNRGRATSREAPPAIAAGGGPVQP